MGDRTRTRAVVTLTMEVSLPDAWGDDCDLKQVYSQGAEAALGVLRIAFGQTAVNDATRAGAAKCCRVVSELTAVRVIVEAGRG